MSDADDGSEDVEVVEVDEDGHRPGRGAGEAGRRARRILPGDSDFGDPLSTSGDEASQQLGRRIAEISADRPSLLRELGLGTLQVYEALASGGWGEQGETEVTVVFTDLVALLRLGARAPATPPRPRCCAASTARSRPCSRQQAGGSSSGSATA